MRSKGKKDDHKQFSLKAKRTVTAAINGEQTIDSIGDFIFLSALTGEAWILDHRENLALRLADKYEPLPYKISETQSQLKIEWNEHFKIENGAFISGNSSTSSVFNDYPIALIEQKIAELQQGEN